MNWSEFWHMGGYALYVWSSFGVTALLMIAEPLLVGARCRNARRRIARLRRLQQEENR